MGAALSAWEGRRAGAWARRLGVGTAEFHARIGSTSDRARELAARGARLPALVVADRQSAGRGRRGRRWASDSAKGLWMTVALDVAVAPDPAGGAASSAAPRTSTGGATPGGDAAAAHGPAPEGGLAVLPLLAGLAAARAVESVAPAVRVRIKWPNDLLAGGRKLAGILCERAGPAVLLGIGVNANHDRGDLPVVPAPGATSILLETGRSTPRGVLLEALAGELGVVRPLAKGEIPALELAALNRRSALRGRPVRVSEGVAAPARKVRDLAALAGDILPDGSLELSPEASAKPAAATPVLRLVAGSVRLDAGHANTSST